MKKRILKKVTTKKRAYLLRCSKEVYDYVTQIAEKTGNPVTVILDRWMVIIKELEKRKSGK